MITRSRGGSRVGPRNGPYALRQPKGNIDPQASNRFAAIEAHRRDTSLCLRAGGAEGGRVHVLQGGRHEGGHPDEAVALKKLAKCKREIGFA